MSFFTDDVIFASYAVSCLRIVSLGVGFYGYGMVLTQSFNEAADTWTPTFVALAACYSLLAVVSAIVFRQGRWKTKAI